MRGRWAVLLGALTAPWARELRCDWIACPERISLKPGQDFLACDDGVGHHFFNGRLLGRAGLLN